jgi:NMD protein affecting ribosome stability and mRNA decay
MRATKRYSRSTTKKAIDMEKDPYLSKLGPVNMAACSGCFAVYHNKRWRLAQEGERTATYHKTICPACQKIRDNFAGGYVTLRGGFLGAHKEEILNLVKNKEARARYKNPLERIIEIKEKRGFIEITTTTDKFAQMLGKIIHKAFGGKVEYKWAEDVKIARINWARD